MLGGAGIIYQAKITTNKANLNEFSSRFIRYLTKTKNNIISTIYLTTLNGPKRCVKSFEFLNLHIPIFAKFHNGINIILLKILL